MIKAKLLSVSLLSYRCIVTINVLWLFLMVPWVGLQRVILVFPDHTHLFFLSLTTSELALAVHTKKHGSFVPQCAEI